MVIHAILTLVPAMLFCVRCDESIIGDDTKAQTDGVRLLREERRIIGAT